MLRLAIGRSLAHRPLAPRLLTPHRPPGLWRWAATEATPTTFAGKIPPLDVAETTTQTPGVTYAHKESMEPKESEQKSERGSRRSGIFYPGATVGTLVLIGVTTIACSEDVRTTVVHQLSHCFSQDRARTSRANRYHLLTTANPEQPPRM